MNQFFAVGEKLRALRKSAGLSLLNMSISTGLSISHISEVERGTNDPSFSTLCKFADSWGMSLSQLLEDVPTISQARAQREQA